MHWKEKFEDTKSIIHQSKKFVQCLQCIWYTRKTTQYCITACCM